MENFIIQPCVNRKATRVPNWRYCKYEAKQLRLFLKQGTFRGNYQKPFSLSHSYVSFAPLHFFVISEDYNGGELLKAFGSWCIVNLKIISFSDLVYWKEACMAFPFREPKRVDRANKITVEYYVPFLWTWRKVKRKLEGLPAFIAQHETEHASGKNIYFND